MTDYQEVIEENQKLLKGLEGESSEYLIKVFPPHESDLGNAKRLVATWGKDLRYCHQWGCWFIWDDKKWEKDSSGKIFQFAKETVLEMYDASIFLEDQDRQKMIRHALRSESQRGLNAMVALAESENGIPISPDSFDSNPWLLNCLNGTIDLKTGELREHRREDLITKIIQVDYDPKAECPIFDLFLAKVLDGDLETIDFTQRAVGYSLTGLTIEQCFFLLYGIGANGKSTFLETFREMLGDYATQADPSAFLYKGKGQNGIPNDIARLKGARFVSAVEVEAGRRMAEVIVKQLTGLDTVTARFLHKEFFEFKPQFKAFLGCNHKPIIKGTDHAISGVLFSIIHGYIYGYADVPTDDKIEVNSSTN